MYWRSVFADLNEAFGWKDEYIWTLTEAEINTKMYELRIRSLNKTLNEYLSYGNAGIEELYKLLPTDPVRRLYEKRTARDRKQQERFDAMMLRRIQDDLNKKEIASGTGSRPSNKN